ncbi:MAG: cellulase family glycosylhydrolase [Spirochaetales bacterium]|nr:cellulase family glycosylhydrolase [Spirochaetales bacterium]
MLIKRFKLKIYSILTLLLSVLLSCTTGQVESVTTKKERIMSETNATRIVLEMTAGWNLGNTMDATGGETGWGNPVTTKEMIVTIAEAGFNTLRLPVSWGQFTGEAPNYLISQEQVTRVREIVDYAIDNDMYVILNMHHEDHWLIPTTEKADIVVKQYQKMWEQIATAFNDYNDKLLFEAMNEPRVVGSPNEWIGGDEESYPVINKLNKVFVETVRNTGGNNQYRALLVTPYGANGKKGAMNFEIPEGDNLIISIHSYDPVRFTFYSESGEDLKNWDGKYNSEIDDLFETLYDEFVIKGYPVVLTEFGSTTKEYTTPEGVTGPNEEEILKWASYFIQRAKKSTVKTVWWDNGRIGMGDDFFALLDRKNNKIIKPKLVKGMIDAAKASPATLLLEPEVGAGVKVLATGFVDEQGRAKAVYGTPSIDGNADSIWNSADFITPGFKSGSGVKADFKVKMMWDEENLYYLINVTDPVLNKKHKDSWEQDSLELFLDEDNDKAKSYKKDDIQFRIRFDNKYTGGQGNNKRLTSEVSDLLDDSGNIIGYTLEASIKWLNSHEEGTVMGYDIQYNDAGDINARMGTVNLYDDTNGTWNNPSKMGELILIK